MTRSRGTTRGSGRGGAPSDRRPTSTESADDGGRSEAGPATRASSSGRFRPKAIRRDEADRDELARREAQKASERAAEELRARGRSRFRSKRSRGDAMGSRGRGISTASGPFSGGFSGASSSGGAFRSGGGGGGGGFFGGGGGGGARSNQTDTKAFAAADGSQSRRETRINADKLHVMTADEELDSDDEAMRAALHSRPSSSALPMGIYRREHQDTGIVVATTAELEAAEKAKAVVGEEESLWVDGDDGRPLPCQPTESGVWDAKLDGVRIKKEEVDGDAMDLDRPTSSKEVAGDEVKSKRSPKVAGTDLEERNLGEDMALLASELGAVSVSVSVSDSEPTKPETTNKDGRLYLFQFPPLLPPLRPTKASATSTKVKFQDTSSSRSPSPSTSPTGRGQGLYGFDAKTMKQGGLIGSMRVHRSGRTEIDWGCNSSPTLEMSPGAPVSFVTTAVIVEESDQQQEQQQQQQQQQQQGVVGGYSFAMGPVMGRFVVAPVWAEEEDWDVDLQHVCS